jgi:hypothetical protein
MDPLRYAYAHAYRLAIRVTSLLPTIMHDLYRLKRLGVACVASYRVSLR